MRLWSIHPKYLDRRAIVALWREGLLARNVLLGKTKGYTKHPQLERFRQASNPVDAIDFYLEAVAVAAKERGYTFDQTKINVGRTCTTLNVTSGQMEHELKHFKSKLLIRDKEWLARIGVIEGQVLAEPHPLFTIIPGEVEPWERRSDAGDSAFPYGLDFATTDFRKNPELYRVGIGEQGVLLVEPYKSEILPHWRFRDEGIAKKSARKIYSLFIGYRKAGDFVGMDMARKFLQMGYTRARRYANHKSGRKYGAEGEVLPQADNALSGEKAKAARVFYGYYLKAREDSRYKKLRREWQKRG